MPNVWMCLKAKFQIIEKKITNIIYNYYLQGIKSLPVTKQSASISIAFILITFNSSQNENAAIAE